MMTTEEVLAFVKSLSAKADNYYAGMMNNKKERSFGVYSLKERRRRDVALGGMSNTKTAAKGISILVHWTKSTRETEAAAQALYEALAAVRGAMIGRYKADYIQLLHNEPIDVGSDESGICERVIEFIIYYERS